MKVDLPNRIPPHGQPGREARVSQAASQLQRRASKLRHVDESAAEIAAEPSEGSRLTTMQVFQVDVVESENEELATGDGMW